MGKNMKSLSSSLVLSFTAAGLLLASTEAKAGPLSLTITQAYQTGSVGELLTFDATLTDTAATGTIYLNSDSTTLSGPLLLDDTPFFNNFPMFLNPGDSITAELFTVFIQSGAPQGVYPGAFEILGGSPSDFTSVVASANFDVNVSPEPTSFLLLLAGLLTIRLFGFQALFRRRVNQ
jgi:hypothetical protein